MRIYKGEGVTLVLKNDGEFVTVFQSGEGMDLSIQYLE